MDGEIREEFYPGEIIPGMGEEPYYEYSRVTDGIKNLFLAITAPSHPDALHWKTIRHKVNHGYVAWFTMPDGFTMKVYAFRSGEAILQLEFDKLTNPRFTELPKICRKRKFIMTDSCSITTSGGYGFIDITEHIEIPIGVI